MACTRVYCIVLTIPSMPHCPHHTFYAALSSPSIPSLHSTVLTFYAVASHQDSCNRTDGTEGPMYNAMILPYAQGPMALSGFTWCASLHSIACVLLLLRMSVYLLTLPPPLAPSPHLLCLFIFYYVNRYQGEANTENQTSAEQYKCMSPL